MRVAISRVQGIEVGGERFSRKAVGGLKVRGAAGEFGEGGIRSNPAGEGAGIGAGEASGEGTTDDVEAGVVGESE